MRLNIKLLFFFIATSGSTSTAQVIELDPATVTATLSEEKSSRTGRNILVLKGELFNKLPVHSIDELLRYLPGIEVQQRGPQGGQSDLLIRGGTFQQVLVILDGIRLNDPLTGHFNAYIPIAPQEIDQIEILKGSSSAIYGSEAVGGVIHVISKSFAGRRGPGLPSGGASFTVGEYGLKNINAGGGWRGKDLAYSAGLISNNAAGHLQRGIRGYFYNSTGSISVKKWISKNWYMALRTAVDKRNFAAQNFYTVFTSDTAREQVTSWWNHIQAGFEHGRQKVRIDAGYKKCTDEYQFNPKAAANNNKSALFQSQFIYENRISKLSRINSGLQWVQSSIRSNDRGNHAVNNVAAFVMFQTGIGNHFRLSPAIRTDYNGLAGWELVPQLNLSYNTGVFLFRGSAGKATRVADFTERYNNYQKPLVTNGNIGNPGLVAEEAWNYELGTDFILSNSLRLSVSGFIKDYRSLIDWVNTPYSQMPRKDNLSPLGNYYLAKNIYALQTMGLETDLQIQQKIANDHSINAGLGLIWLNSGKGNSLYISSHARFMINYSLLYQYKWLQLSSTGLYKSREPQAGSGSFASLSSNYFIMNGKVAVVLPKHPVTIFLQCDNVGKRNYADRYGVPMPGRWVSGGFQYLFNN